MTDIESWCDETLPELYDEGMFDCEDISEEVWDAVTAAMDPLLEDESEEFAAELQNAATVWFRAHHEIVLNLLEPKSVAALCDRPQVTQHSADWYNQRRNRLTASEFAQILDGRRGALLRQKLNEDRVFTAASPVGIAQPDGEMNATTWGHRFEPITRRIYELEIAGVGTVCDTLGRFTHSTIPWLSASPDGVVTRGALQGRLVEIKSPKTRKPGEFVPYEYYVQMQVQMEVCDLDSVEFVEAQFAQKPIDAMTIGDLTALAKARWKGEIEVRGDLEDPATWRYRYTEPVEDSYEATFVDEETHSVLEHSVWWLTGWYPRTVLRNREWWRTVGRPAAEKFWAEVCALREGNAEEAEAEAEGWMGSSS